MKIQIEDVVRRVDAARCTIANPQGVPITLLASGDVPIEREAIEQVLGFVSLEDTLRQLSARGFFGDATGRITQVVLTPDFHYGAGIPVGTVAQTEAALIPQAVGNDICCGMRLLATDLRRDQLLAALPSLSAPLRNIFFGGQRDIPLSPRQREAMLRDGLWGVCETAGDNAGAGLWAFYDPRAEEEALDRVHLAGVMPARGTFAFADWIRGSGASDGRDAQIGSVGGGNHFVELQAVDELCDGFAAREWGLEKDQVTIMVHSGSVGLGHTVGGHFVDKARKLFPRALPHPAHGFYVLPTSGPHAAEGASYLDAMSNAANFAFANRLFLGLMAVRALTEAVGRKVTGRLVYDAPHNLIWPASSPGGLHLHRKGACPAPGALPEATGGPFRYTGHPVIIPGSMGSHSYVLAGAGEPSALASACHGAGRSLSRGATHAVEDAVYEAALAPLHVVTPIDPDAYEIRSRRDVLARFHQRLREEAPYAYKPITPVIETVELAGVARRVARLWPHLTVKG